MIVIIDAHLGNLRNVEKAFERLGYPVKISADKKEIESARALVFPGVGHFGKAMENINKMGLKEIIKIKIASGVPCLGICLGMQLLFETSEEAPGAAGLAVLPGAVKKFPPEIKLKIPQIGWNNLKFKGPADEILAGLPDNEMFYFVHSYYVAPAEPEMIIGTTVYGLEFAAAVRRQRLWGIQFHPEKSGRAGLHILDNFGKICAS